MGSHIRLILFLIACENGQFGQSYLVEMVSIYKFPLLKNRVFRTASNLVLNCLVYVSQLHVVFFDL